VSPRDSTRVRRRLLAGAALAAVLVWGGGAAAAQPDLGARLEAELRLRSAEVARDRPALDALFAGEGPGALRGQALWALYRGAPAPLAAAERSRLLKALADPDATVRQAALRSVAATGDRALEREALKRVAEDSDPAVRLEALRAVGPWGRQGHLYFLEQALGASEPAVRAGAVRNLARISFRELPPEVFARIEGLAGAANAEFGVRGEALQALHGWGRLDWAVLASALGERVAPESFRLRTLVLSDTAPRAEGRGPVLLETLATDPSLRVAWECFRRLVRAGGGESELGPAVARLLSRVAQKNAATEEMAAFLTARGYRVEHRAGAWNVSAR